MMNFQREPKNRRTPNGAAQASLQQLDELRMNVGGKPYSI